MMGLSDSVIDNNVKDKRLVGILKKLEKETGKNYSTIPKYLY